MNKIKVKSIDEIIYHEKLDNGLEIYIYPKKNFNTITARFVTFYGSNDYEFVPINKKNIKTYPLGIAHFLEHKIFESSDNSNIFEKFEKYGASVNAFTNHEITCYYFSTTKNVGKCLNLLLDFVQSPYFTDENVEKEKGIINQEINMTGDDIGRFVFEKMFYNALVNLPDKNKTIGTKESIDKITKEDLYDNYNAFYNPSNMILTISGDVNVKKIIDLVKNNQAKKEFEKIDKIVKKEYKEPSKVNKEYELIKKKVAIPRLSLCYKFKTDKLSGSEKYTYSLFLFMFLEMKFSDITSFDKMLIDKKIINSVLYYYSKIFEDTVLISFETDIINEKEFNKEVDKKLKDNVYDKSKFELLKKAYLASVVRAYESPSSIAAIIHHDISTYGKFIDNAYDLIRDFSYEKFLSMISTIDLNNKSIIRIEE